MNVNNDEKVLKMKKLALATAGIALASVLASTAMAAECSFSGFTVGLGAGVSTLDTQTKFTAPVSPINRYDSTKSNFAATGGVAKLFAAYTKHFPNRFALGAEIYGYLSSNNKTNSITDLGEIKTQRTNGFGIVLKPGMVFGNALFFLKGGIGSAQLKNTYSMYGIGANSNTVLLTGDKKQRVMEIPVGAGIDFLVNEKFILGLEGTYTFTKERKFGLKTVVGGIVAPDTNVKVKSNDLQLGVRFAAKI